MPEKKPFEELLEEMRDIDIPDDHFKPYLTADPKQSRPLAPELRPNPDTVDFTPEDEFLIEGAMGLGWANGVCRWRRRERFKRRRSAGSQRPVLVTEGDSWFQFPFLLEDVVDHLGTGYDIWDVAAAGDTLEDMIDLHPEYMAQLEERKDDFVAFLFSGGGNDIVGEDRRGASVLEQILRPFEAGRPASWYLQTDAFGARLAQIENWYRGVLSSVQAAFPTRPVLVHGYDYAIPGGYPGDTRDPGYAAQDEWIGRFLCGPVLGITDITLQRDIVRLMIDRLNEAQQRLCGGNCANGAFPRAYHVDIRQTLAIGDWNDELHPTDAAFGTVAGKFAQVLAQATAAV